MQEAHPTTRSSVLDHPLISERYFFPRPGPSVAAGAVWLELDQGVRVGCALARSGRADAPLLLHFHGNGELVTDYVPLVATAFNTAGLDVLFVEYRGYGPSSGTPALATLLDDVEAVLQWAAATMPRARTFVYGRSVGSIYAIEAARRAPDLGGLIIESGIADPLERILLRVTPEELGTELSALQQEAARLFDHRAKLGAYPGRVLVLHAAGDDLVDPSHAERNARWARRAELVLLPHGDHNSILAYHLADIVDRVQRFVVAG